MNSQIKNPTVAVIIPVYSRTERHEAYLTDALKSVAAQTFRDFEVIIVDDASPRDITPVLAQVDLPSIKIIRNEQNLGHVRSRNKAVEATQAEYIAFLDHDDLWAADKLEKQVQYFEKNAGVGMVFCRVTVFGSHAHRLDIDQSIIPDSPTFVWLINHGNYVITFSSVLVRRSALLEIGLFDSRYSTCDDFDAWLKIVRRHPIAYMPETLASYRLHSMNANYGVDRLNDNRLLTSLLFDYWKAAPLGEKVCLIYRITRKLMGRLYFRVFRHRSFRD